MTISKNQLKSVFYLSAASVALLAGGSAFAQEEVAPVTTTDEALSGMVDIVVTARRRAENLQDVPIAVTALGGAALEKGGITSVLDIAKVTPNVTMTQFNVGEPQTYVRGVGSQTDSAASESSVTVSVDDVPIGRGGAPSVAFLDVSRIEVLRGPQGTLYGRNASAGTISFYANRPEDSFSGYVEGSYGSFDTYGAKAIINTPVAEGFALRAAGQYSHSDGYAKNIATGERLQGGERYAGRLQLQAETGAWVFLISGDYSKDDLTGDSRYVVGSSESSPGLLAVANAIQAPYAGDVWKSSGFPGTFQKRRNYGIVGRIEYDAGWSTITSVSAYRNNEYSLRADYSGLRDAFPLRVDDRIQESSHQVTQELRLNSPSTSKIQWVAGLFYYKDDVDRVEQFVVTANAPIPAVLGGDNTGSQAAQTTSYAAFAQATLPFAEIFELTLGGRLTHDKKEVFQTLVHNGPAGSGVGFPFFPGSPYAVPAKASFTKPTWRVTLAAEPAPGKHIYLSYDRGYKSGTFTSQAQNAVQAGFLVKPEKLDSFDLGFKTQWLDNSLRLNADAFYLKYQDLQVFEFGQTLNFVLANADATVKGVEVQAVIAPTRNFNSGFNFSYQDAKFTSNPFFSGATLPYDGNRLSRAPKIKWSTFVELSQPVGSGTATVRANYDFQDAFYYNPANDAASLQKSYGVLGAFAAWESSNGLKLSLTGTNLLNEKYSVHHISFQGLGLRIFSPPRAVTFAVSKSF
ncbi:TonB-dependent receptor [Rhizorhapis suberifaciens]|uniref:Iron complex outermembrane receptor protein n=1 Tax=Rhizorhapis suberifaciens TaxID=13656 RepID=A0A840HRG9_9SPHN|nr:TonB-dependent receptor [Rhizorhapis suberifaciens]MBB4640188.1 iron complex outermembrane receptor protein [Rhizorhapis suberifaciens]